MLLSDMRYKIRRRGQSIFVRQDAQHEEREERIHAGEERLVVLSDGDYIS